MNKSVFAGAAIAALMASGAAYAQQGHVELTYQSNDLPGSDSIDSTGLSGAVLLGPNVQVSGRYASVDGFGSTADYWDVEGFLFSRSTGGSWGGYLGYDTISGSGSSPDEWSIGGFLQAFTSNANWTASLNYSDTKDWSNITSLDGEGRFFVSDNFSLQANLGYGNIDIDGGGSNDYWSGGLGAEVGFAGSPISIYGGWQHYDFDSANTNTYGIGVRWNFGGGTVKDNSRSGASFSRVSHTAAELELGGGFAPRN